MHVFALKVVLVKMSFMFCNSENGHLLPTLSTAEAKNVNIIKGTKNELRWKYKKYIQY
jgi:hypothetical protein